MARKRRIEFEGGLYHVLAGETSARRSSGQRTISPGISTFFRSTRTIYHFSLFAYALMPNHVHLLVETAQVPLSKIIQGLNQSYTMYFNRKYETVGHLFQGRYKAILCDRDEYLLTLIKYIHLNPVRAKTAEVPGEYPWSSHNAYINKASNSGLVDTDLVLRLFSERERTAIKRYLEFMHTGPVADRKEIYGTVDQRLLGDEQFVEDIKSRIPAEITGNRRQRHHSLGKIAMAIERRTAVSMEQMRAKTKSRTVTDGRRLFCKIAKDFSYRNHEIANFLRKDPAAVTRYLKNDVDLKVNVKNVLDELEG